MSRAKEIHLTIFCCLPAPAPYAVRILYQTIIQKDVEMRVRIVGKRIDPEELVRLWPTLTERPYPSKTVTNIPAGKSVAHSCVSHLTILARH